MKIKSLCFFTALLFVGLPTIVFSQNFLHRQDKKIVNGSGQEIYLKGIGLGGWLLQEGYMLQTSGFANAQWQIREKIAGLIGETSTEEFYEIYRDNFIRKIDIDSIRSWGFNSIRLPFHYNLFAENSNPPVFLNKGFEIVDSLLAWCEENQIYLILDMHAAPGGQSDEPISDYNPAYPSLWESELNKNLTVQVWRKIAEHYKDKEWIGGYDLLNEPKWSLPGNQALRDLYIRITDTIRAVDNNHIIFIEGNWFATDFSGLTPPWDDNMAYSFHKYWNVNSTSAIQSYINLRNSTNCPLWLGETGENSNKWFVDCVELMKNNNIGWAWWPLKKIESIAGPLSAVKLPAYQNLLNYWSGSGSPPTAQYAYDALVSQVYKLRLENCIYQKDVIDALIRQPFNTVTRPFAVNEIPGIIHASDYDLGKLYYAYKDNVYENTGGATYNSGWSYRNDGVDIENSNAFLSNGYNVGWVEPGEWLKHTVNVLQSGTYDINVSVASANTGGKLYLTLDNQNLTPVLDIPNTGGWQNWQYLTVTDVYIPSGQHELMTRFLLGGYNISYIEFFQKTVGVEDEISGSFDFDLMQNYPNPFNSSTYIKYSVGYDTEVTITLYDIMGKEVEVLVNEFKHPGNYDVRYDAKDLSSGLYFYGMKAGNYVNYRKIILLK